MTTSGFELVFLLDEFDSILQADAFSAEFQAYLRSLANGYDLAWVTASTARLGEISSEPAMSSPFFNIFSVIPLGPMRREEAVELITVPSRKQGLSLEQDTDFLLDLAGLHPLLLQIACCGLFEARATLRLLTPKAYEHTSETFAQEALDHFKYAWSHLSPADRQAHIAACAEPDASLDTSIHYLLGSSGYHSFVRQQRGKGVEIIKLETVRDALNHLDDPEYLARSPLATLDVIASQFALSTSLPSSLEAGHAVQEMLKNAIKALKPIGAIQDEKNQLYFDTLNLVYWRGYSPRQVMMDLALSERTYYRELKRALERLIVVLRDMEARH